MVGLRMWISIGLRSGPEGCRAACSLTCSLAWYLESTQRSEEHTSELQSQSNLVCRLLLEKKNEARPFVMLSQICTAHCSSGNQFLSRTTLPRGGRCSVFLARLTSANRVYYLSTSESMRPSGERNKGCLSIL